MHPLLLFLCHTYNFFSTYFSFVYTREQILQHLAILLICAGFLILCRDSLFYNNFPTLRTKHSPAQVMSHTAQYLVYFNLPFVQRTHYHPPLRTNLLPTQPFLPHNSCTRHLAYPTLRTSAHLSVPHF